MSNEPFVDSRWPFRYFDRPMSAPFITFEGLDLSGKSTQVSRLKVRLESGGREVLVLREPGGTGVGEHIRTMLLDSGNMGMSDACELFLFSASRSELVRSVIRPALSRGVFVLCDRFYDSTTAYQGGGRGIARSTIDVINMTATGGLEPDLTFFLDVEPEEIERRMQKRGQGLDRMERTDASFRARVRASYLDLARHHPRFRVLDGRRSVEEVAEDIWECVHGMEVGSHAE